MKKKIGSAILIPSLCLIALYYLTRFIPEGSLETCYIVLPLIVIIIICAPIIYILSLITQLPVFGNWKFPPLWLILVLLIIAYFSRVLISPFMTFPTHIEHICNGQIILEVFNKEYSKQGFLQLSFNIIYIACVIPILEEIIFRKLIQSFLIKKTTLIFGILLSSTLFALFHFTLINFIAMLLWGVILGIIYSKTASLWCSIITHSFINIILHFVTYQVFDLSYIHMVIYITILISITLILKYLNRVNI